MVVFNELHRTIFEHNVDRILLEDFTPTKAPKLQHLPKRPPIDLEFHNLSYETKPSFNQTSKILLKCISGQMQSGELTAIMGPSGAGKSTLLNCLSGYKKTGLTGSILINGLERNLKLFRKYSCYIMQENHLHGNLTIQESMTVATNLKLDMTMTREEKDNIIEDILATLSLTAHRHTYASKLSGGERKRLSIALELVSNPPVMFFDEPTSGLDSNTCYQCIRLLKMLATGGRTIIITIHQPSAMLCAMFDHLYALSDGNCIYQGSLKALVPFLSKLGLNCPSYSNPTDYLIEVATGEHGDMTNQLIESVQNGKFNTRKVDNIKNANALALQQQKSESIDMNEGETKAETAAYATTQWNQFFVVLKRAVLFTLRDWTLMYLRIAAFIVVAVLMSLEFYGSGNDANKVLGNIALLVFTMLFITFTSIVLAILAIPMELHVMTKETFNNWYSLRAYYLAITIADIPFLVVFTTIYVAIIYYFSAQPPELYRFGLMWLVCVLLSHIAQTIGIILGATFKISIAAMLGPAINLPMLVFSGFFIAYKAMPAMLRGFTYTSYVHYAFEGAMLAIYAYDRPNLQCQQAYCHFKKPLDVLEKYDMLEDTYWLDVVALVAILLMFKTIAYFLLKYKLQSRQ